MLENTSSATGTITRRQLLTSASITAAGVAATSLLAASNAKAAEAVAQGASIYQGYAPGFMGGFTVDIAIKDDEIVGLWVVENHERFWTQPSESVIENLPQRMIDNQSLAVDGITGATFSSRSLLSAAQNALEDAGIDTDPFMGEVSHERMAGEDVDVDVLVIGSGLSGEIAALTAATEDLTYQANGLKVMMVDREYFAGGSSAASGGGMISFTGSRANEKVGAQMTADEAVDSIEADNDGDFEANRELVSAMFDVEGDTVDKILDLGVFAVARAGRTAFPDDEGGAAAAMLRAKEYTTVDRIATGIKATDILITTCEEMGVDLRLGTDVVELLADASGAVTGARVQDYDSEYTVNAKKVILCCGGFARNSDLMSQYASDYDGAIIFCNGGNNGDAIQMALEMGAELRGYGAIAYPGTLTNGILGKTSQATHYCKGIWVNENGERFDDGRQFYPGPWGSARFAKYINAQPDHLAYNVFDSTADYAQLFDTAMTTESNGGIKADTIEELAEKMGVPFDALQASIDNAAAAVEAGTDEEFGVPVELFGTMTEPPFYAIEMHAIVIGSKVGLNVDTDCRVLGADGEPIENLYAAGEAVFGNFFSDYYVMGGGSLANCAMTGRLAGEAARASLSG